MPYADKTKRLEYQNKWIKARREEWISSHGPCSLCGSSEKLEVHHLDPATKVTHKIWSYSEVRRLQELAKCVVLCNPCHKAQTAQRYQLLTPHGSEHKYRKYGCLCDKCRLAYSRGLDRLRSAPSTIWKYTPVQFHSQSIASDDSEK